MRDSAKSSRNGHSQSGKSANLAVFRAELGWIGLVGQDDVLWLITIGHDTADKVRQEAKLRLRDLGCGERLIESDWHPDLRERLQSYSRGDKVDFRDIKIELPPRTAFQEKVISATRRIGHGRTLTYGELAAKAGFPRAARAVGTVMSSNRFPIIIPCHRVVGSAGSLGGYSAPSGVCLKQWLLDLERSDK